MSFGKKETVRVVETPAAPTPPPPPPAAPQQADAARDIAASRATDTTGNIQSTPGGTPGGYTSLINTSTTGLTRKADTRKRSLIGGE